MKRSSRSFVRDEAGLSPARLRDQLGEQTRQALGPSGVLRVGGDGGRDRRTARRDRRAPLGPRERTRDEGAEVSGRVFKIERTPAGERVAYVRLFTGTLRPRQRVRVGGGEDAKPTSIKVFAPSGAPRRDVADRRGDGCRPRARRRAGRGRHRRTTAGPGGDCALPASGPRGSRVPAPAGAVRQPQGGPRAARRTGPAHRRAPGRAPARDRRLALRGGAEGGHPGHARARLRHRRRLPRDDHRVHRAPGARRRGRGGHPGEDEDEHHRQELPTEHEPVQGHLGPPDRASPDRVRDRVPERRRGSATSRCTSSTRSKPSRHRWKPMSARH